MGGGRKWYFASPLFHLGRGRHGPLAPPPPIYASGSEIGRKTPKYYPYPKEIHIYLSKFIWCEIITTRGEQLLPKHDELQGCSYMKLLGGGQIVGYHRTKKIARLRRKFFSDFAVKVALENPKLTEIRQKSAKYHHSKVKAPRKREFFGVFAWKSP